jgi:hypothetical protein
MSICNPVFTRSSPPLLTVDDDTIAVVRRLCIDVNIILETSASESSHTLEDVASPSVRTPPTPRR